jgi:cell division protein FtsQ
VTATRIDAPAGAARAPRDGAAPTSATPTRRTPVVLAGIALACAAFAFVAPIAFRQMDYFHLQRVELVGARYLAPTEVTAALRTDTSASVFDDLDTFASRLASLPLVARAEVDRKLPGTLVVRIAERTPVALVTVGQGLRAVDTTGAILPIDPVATPVDAPIIAAPRGPRDAGADTRLLAFLGRLRAQDPVLFDRIETAQRVSASEWQLRSTGGVRLRVTPEVTVGRLATIFPVEQDLQQRRLHAVELDLRFRNLVIARLP